MITKVSENPADLISLAVSDFEKLAIELLATKDQIRVLLTGGTLGIEFIRSLGKLDLDFSRIWMMFSDERFVPYGHLDRNENQGIAVWPELADHLVRFPDAKTSLTEAREQFENQRIGLFEDGVGFDLTILGMGPDGHVASLFPGHNQPGKWIIAEPNSPKPTSERLSLSYEALEQSKRVWFLAAGEAKSWAVGQAMNTETVPASQVRGELETVWYLDKSLSDAL